MFSIGSSAVGISERIFSFFDYGSLNKSNRFDNVDSEFDFNLCGELSVRLARFVLFKSVLDFKIEGI